MNSKIRPFIELVFCNLKWPTLPYCTYKLLPVWRKMYTDLKLIKTFICVFDLKYSAIADLVGWVKERNPTMRNDNFIVQLLQSLDRRSRNILDSAISITRSPLVAKSCQTKAQAGHKAEESCSNPFQASSAPNYSPCQQAVSARNRYPQNHRH